MSGRGATAEKHILDLFKNHNRPFSVQGVADFVAQFGVKKAQVQKILDSLVDNQRLTAKEFGKTRIFWPNQSDDAVLSKEEMEQKRKELNEMKETAQREALELAQMQKESQMLTTALTMEEIETDIEKLMGQKEEMTRRLTELSGNSVAVTPEEKHNADEMLEKYLRSWKKWKAAFREIWGAVSENMDRKQSELFEEIGVDTDEDAGCSFEEMNKLISKKRRRAR